MRRCLSILVMVGLLPAALSAQTGASFTDDPLVPGVTPIRAIHLTELRARINALYTANSLPVFSFTDPVLTTGVTAIRAIHVIELRTAVSQLYTALGKTPPVFVDLLIEQGLTVVRAVHITELRAAVIALESSGPNENEDPLLSPAVITLVNVAENTFNDQFAQVRFEIANGQFSVNPDHVQVFYSGRVVDSAFLEITSTAIVASWVLVDGPNDIELLARDAAGRYIDFSATLWAGSAELSGRVVDENGLPIQGATVTARLGIDERVTRSAISTAAGDFSFSNVPGWTVLLDSITSGNRLATASVRGTAGFIQITAMPIGAPSPVNNNDFSLGTAGWNIGTAPVQIVPHVDAVTGPVPAVNDFDLQLNTSGEGAQRISRTFNVTPGVRNITVKYRFVTSEVPGGFFGTEFDDSFSVSVRSQSGLGVISESATMNSLGLAAFDAGGATQWRQTSLSVDSSGDVVRVDLSVANVADGLYDSYLVIDMLSETNLAITQLTLNDIDNTSLKYLSASDHSYFGGNTRIHGTVTVEGDSNDSLQALTLEVIQGGAVRAVANLAAAMQPILLTSFGPSGKVQVTTSTLLFELPSAQAQNVDGSADSSLTLRLRARAASGKEATFDAGVVTLLVRYAGSNRYGGRDPLVGGDDWAQPGMRTIVEYFTGNLYGDFSNMNGGPFSPHAEHRTGDDVDGWFTGYNARNAATAATIIGHLNDPVQGSNIARVLVTFEKVDTNAFWNAIKTVVLDDGRLARDVIRPMGGHETHFHWDRVTAAQVQPSLVLTQRRANVR